MTYREDIAKIRDELFAQIASQDDPGAVLRSDRLKGLFLSIKDQPSQDRASYGQLVNELKIELEEAILDHKNHTERRDPIDLTSPFDVNAPLPDLLGVEVGSQHPISQEILYMSDILQRMGFRVYDSREIDDQYHMFDTLNFPKGHPARDDYDTFQVSEQDESGMNFVAPAHTSTMQNRILTELRPLLEKDQPIAATSIDRVFRNEDVDARHEHTFYQHEGIYVSKGIHAGMLVATLQTFLEGYFEKTIEVRINPFYFPFTEPSFEFNMSCPFCEKSGCNVCSQSGWIELLGCGMIHPNVLKMAEIDPEIYTGFAWGGGVDRMIMMKHGIEDVRHFHSGKLNFLRQF
jgi:phenylalanyl-tRNA synthetase alpha chain